MPFWSVEHKKFEVNKKNSLREFFLLKRHRAIFPGLEDPSIVTAERLDCCVRYGNRYFPLAMGTERKRRLRNVQLSISNFQ